LVVRQILTHGSRDMAKSCIIILVLAFSFQTMASSDETFENPTGQLDRQLILQNLNSSPLCFTENKGQWDERALYMSQAGAANLWFTSEGVYYQFFRQIASDKSEEQAGIDLPYKRGNPQGDSIEQLFFKASFINGNPNPEAKGNGLIEYRCNYFFGNDSAKWYMDVPNYQSIYYEEIYPGINLRYYGNKMQMEYDFIVSPGADYRCIRIQYEGVESLSINSFGDLVVETGWGSIIERKPFIYQVDGRNYHQLEGTYEISEGNSFFFNLEGHPNPELPLIIDPILVYSTFLGGSGPEKGFGIAVDDSGCAYVVGATYSPDFPLQNPYQSSAIILDVFITKLASSGNSLIYSTYLGGSDWDQGLGIAVDSFGAAYITGLTASVDFPIINHYQGFQGDVDVFVTKLSSSGNGLAYSTYLGGFGAEEGSGIAVDSSTNAYVIGYTGSPNFPILNPVQTYQGADDAFITKLSSLGNSLIYSTYLGGSDGHDGAIGIALDGSGCAYITGVTYSADFPTLNPYQAFLGVYDIFVSKLTDEGNSLAYSTCLGGSDGDVGYGIAVDDSGCAFVTGKTLSPDFPVLNPLHGYRGNDDGFVTKLSSSGDSLIYSTYLGGSKKDNGTAIVVDGSGCAYITGFASSPDFPILNPYQAYQGFVDVFVAKLSGSGHSLIFSTYLGGSDLEEGNGIAVDDSGCIYVTGFSESINFPVVEPYQIYQASSDVVIAKLCNIGDFICGDANGDGEAALGDAVYIISYVFLGGDGPNPLESGDVNCDGKIGLVDIVYLVNYVFRGGPAPCDTDADGIPDC